LTKDEPSAGKRKSSSDDQGDEEFGDIEIRIREELER
jgi:hypothetical protein